jgi:LmbE family N-acetylglucosaminyl deacetylase
MQEENDMTKFSRPDAVVYIPDNTEEQQGLARTTHLAVSAHQDDIEIMAVSGVLDCYGRKDQWFTACVVTDGAGSPRDGLYADYTDDEMMAVRREEQKRAAYLGDYGACVLLNHPSKTVKNPAARETVEDIKALLLAARPKVVYTHNLADKHDTHVAVTLRLIAAIRELPKELRPEKLYSCEVWRSLDWVNDDEKTVFDVSEHPGLSNALLGVFDSQVAGGKRYDLASAGRRIANATYFASHAVDKMDAATYAFDISALMDGGDPAEFIAAAIGRFAADVAKKVKGVQ